MSSKVWPVLSLSALLVACAHNRGNERAEHGHGVRAEAHEREHHARHERDEDKDQDEHGDEHRAQGDDNREPSMRNDEPRERGRGDERVEVPRARRQKGQMASAGDGIPEGEQDREHEPDNTGVNERDRGGANVTPMDQGNGEIDLDLTQRIRKAVMGDDSLSFTAKNVKIITRDGQVVLRGPVKSSAEKEAVFRAATREAGVGRVTNQLEVDQD